MKPYIPVSGTHGEQQASDFARPFSTFAEDMQTHLGWAPINQREPFRWSTALDGLAGQHLTWEFSGLALFYYVVPPLCPEKRTTPDDTLIIAFSHGCQVALYAFAHGMKGRLVTVNPPVRSDMDPVITLARPNIRRWVNVYGDWHDVWAVLGAVRDGHFGIRRQMRQADSNILAKGAHGVTLYDRSFFPAFWSTVMTDVSR